MAFSDAGTYPALKSSGRCAFTGVALVPGQPVVAALVRDIDASGRAGEVRRIDAAREAWEAWEGGAGVHATVQTLGSWRTKYEPKDTETRADRLLSGADLLAIFEDLAGTIDEKQTRFRYLVTLLLVRTRTMRVVHTERRAGVTILRVQRRGLLGPSGNPVFDVVDPGLDESTLAEMIEQVGQLVGGEEESAGA